MITAALAAALWDMFLWQSFFRFIGLVIDASLLDFFVLRLFLPLLYTGVTILRALKTL